MTLAIGQEFISNYGRGPLRARIVALDDLSVTLERWNEDSTANPPQRTCFALPLSTFHSSVCGWVHSKPHPSPAPVLPPETTPISPERFNELLNGPLSHPLPGFTISRLARALFFVVLSTGADGAAALERHCKEQEQLDELKEGGEL